MIGIEKIDYGAALAERVRQAANAETLSVSKIVDAALVGKVEIHPSRAHRHHIMKLTPGSWGLTHPLSCDLDVCEFIATAELWDWPPDEVGTYDWLEPGSPWVERKE